MDEVARLAAHMYFSLRREDSLAGTVPENRFADKSLSNPHTHTSLQRCRLFRKQNKWCGEGTCLLGLREKTTMQGKAP